MAHTALYSKYLGFGAAVLLAFGGVSAPVLGQDAAAPAKADAAATPAKPQSAWVKLCDKAPAPPPAKEGETAPEPKEVCLTHHERLDGNTGMVLVSAAIREIDGAKEPRLMVMVPLGMAIPAGVRAAVYTPEQWKKASKNEPVDDKELKPVSLKYSLCHAAGCTAEVAATPEFIEAMQSGGGLMVLAVNAQLKPIAFPVPLTGFTDAHTGKPVDNKSYAKARSNLMAQIRERQIAAAKAYEEVQQQKKPGEAAAPAAEKKQ